GVVRKVPGVASVVIEPQETVEEVRVRLRDGGLAQFGVSRAYAADFLQTALQGEVLSQVLEGQRRFDLLLRLDEPFRSDYDNLKRLRLRLPGRKGDVALDELAEVGEGAGPNAVSRENARRVIVLRCNVAGRDLAGVVEDVRRRVRDEVPL